MSHEAKKMGVGTNVTYLIFTLSCVVFLKTGMPSQRSQLIAISDDKHKEAH
jgi:hypothetical protein